ncbi:MAG: hypothetical protein KDD47_26805 [Acidobacteria bacterium]|nr:hypothetical protein [Acidobacteriota bacterium]
MKHSGEVWRKRLWLWLPALIFFLLNLGAFAYYRLGDFGNQVSQMEGRLERLRERSTKLQGEESELASLVERAATNRSRIETLYDQRLSTQSERLTAVIAEVRDLARQSGLEPSTVSYPEQYLEDFGLERKGFVFAVSGTYADLRKLINALQLTETFVSLDEVGLTQDSGGNSSRLRISLRLSTLFAAEEQAEAGGEA